MAAVIPASIKGEVICLDGAELVFYPLILLPNNADLIVQELIAATPWRQEQIKIYGRSISQPRLTAWYGGKDMTYQYSGVRHVPLNWTPLLFELKTSVEIVCGQQFNSALLNYYRDHRDSMGMHSDDEPELGIRPIIASLSLGAQRTFILQHKITRKRYTLPLPSASLLIMQGDTQTNWRHGIEKEKTPCVARINITFRRL